MIYANVKLGKNVEIDASSTVNNVRIGDKVKIAKRVSIFGCETNILEIGDDTYIGANSFINGFADKLVIGHNVSIAQNVNIMTDSGPNASPLMQRIFPIVKGPITIEDNVWVGASVIIMPNVSIGRCSVIAANSFVDSSFPEYSIIGGTPARLIRTLTAIEIERLNAN